MNEQAFSLDESKKEALASLSAFAGHPLAPGWINPLPHDR
jgi:hypothetical protein